MAEFIETPDVVPTIEDWEASDVTLPNAEEAAIKAKELEQKAKEAKKEAKAAAKAEKAAKKAEKKKQEESSPEAEWVASETTDAQQAAPDSNLVKETEVSDVPNETSEVNNLDKTYEDIANSMVKNPMKYIVEKNGKKEEVTIQYESDNNQYMVIRNQLDANNQTINSSATLTTRQVWWWGKVTYKLEWPNTTRQSQVLEPNAVGVETRINSIKNLIDEWNDIIKKEEDARKEAEEKVKKETEEKLKQQQEEMYSADNNDGSTDSDLV